LSIEARYRETNHEWAKAVDIYRSLWTFFPDDLDYGLRLAAAQVSAGQGQPALQTVQALRQLPPPSRDDPRIDLAEAAAAESLSDFKREIAATAQAREKARRQGSQFTVAQALLDQCWAQRNLGDLEAARNAGEQARTILSNAKDRRGEAASLTCVANVLADQGKPDEARGLHEQALELARQVGAQKDIAGALINLGNILAQQSLPESTARYQEALSVATAVQDKPDMLLAQNNIAANFISVPDFPAATSMLLNALRTADDLGDRSAGVLARSNLSTMYLNLGDIEDAKRYANQALATCKQLNLKSSMGVALVALGDTAFAEDDLSAAEQDYQQALSIRTEIGEKGGIANSWLSLAELDLEKKNFKSAAKLTDDAAEEFHNQHNDDEEAMARDLAARVKRAEGDEKGAQEEAGKSRHLNVQDKTVRSSLDLTEAVLSADTGKPDTAARQFNATIERSQQMKLLHYEFKARLARGEAGLKSGASPAATLDLQRLQKEALEKGFKLIAGKAGHLQK